MSGRGPQSFHKRQERAATRGKQQDEDGEKARTQTPSGTIFRSSDAARRRRIIVTNRKGTPAEARKPDSVPSEPIESQRRISEASHAASSGSPVRQKSNTSKDHKAATRGYRFERARTPGVIEVLNENSYVMAEYSERTGAVKWQRIVLASQREQIEKWLEDHYPKA